MSRQSHPDTMRLLAVLAVSALVAATAASFELEEGVIIGTDANLKSIIDDNEFVLVEFCASFATSPHAAGQCPSADAHAFIEPRPLLALQPAATAADAECPICRRRPVVWPLQVTGPGVRPGRPGACSGRL